MSLAFRLGCGVIASAGLVIASTAFGQVSTDSFGSGANQFNIDFVTISGAPGDGYGGQSAGTQGGGFTTTNIAHDYRIGVFEITNNQWNKFKFAYGTITGSPSGAYDEESYWTSSNVPTNMVSWYEAAQFVNWLNTSTGHQTAYKFNGTQGTGDYALATWSAAEADNGTNLYRHKDAFYYLPTENEWVKAGYWNGTSLQTYATKAGDTLYQGDGVSGAGWNYADGDYVEPYGPWNVGSGSEELNGTFDMMGNVWEFMESPYSDPYYGNSSDRAVRGGSYYVRLGDDFASSNRYNGYHSIESDFVGFRVASEVPEPASMSLLAIGVLALLRRR